MADRQFDRLARALAAPAPRRRVLRALMAAAFGGAAANDAARARPACRLSGESCHHDAGSGNRPACCSGLVCLVTGKGKGRRVCCAPEQVCGGRCCADDEYCDPNTGTCQRVDPNCNPLLCQEVRDGQCVQTCGPCETCVAGQCAPVGDPCSGDATCGPYTTVGMCCVAPSMAVCCCDDPTTGASGFAHCCTPGVDCEEDQLTAVCPNRAWGTSGPSVDCQRGGSVFNSC